MRAAHVAAGGGGQDAEAAGPAREEAEEEEEEEEAAAEEAEAEPALGGGAPEIVAPQIVLPLGKLVEQLSGRANLRQTALVLQPQVVVRGVGGDGGGGGGGGGRGRGRGVGGFRRRSKYKDVLNGDFGREADGFQAGKGLGLVAELPERGAKSSAAAAAAAAAAEAAEAAKWKDASKFVVESALSGYQQLLGERVLLMSEDCVIAKKKKKCASLHCQKLRKFIHIDIFF